MLKGWMFNLRLFVLELILSCENILCIYRLSFHLPRHTTPFWLSDTAVTLIYKDMFPLLVLPFFSIVRGNNNIPPSQSWTWCKTITPLFTKQIPDSWLQRRYVVALLSYSVQVLTALLGAVWQP